MRFSDVHKLASYLLVAAGFAALALSGELSSVVLVATIVLGAASAFFDADRVAFLRATAWNATWTVVTFAGVLYLGTAALRGEPVLLSGAHALSLLLVNKLWNRRGSRDWLQAYVVSFLMLIAGTVLNTDLAFAACFVVYVVAATWALTLLHLRREMEDNYLLKHTEAAESAPVEIARVLQSKRVVGGAFLAGTSTISASVFVVSGVFFFLFPRVGFNLFMTHQRRGLTVGFSDRGVDLGGNGLIKDNQQVVMRVVLPGNRPPERPLYLRGISFDSYRKGRWSPSGGSEGGIEGGGERRPLRRFAGYTMVGVPKSAHLDTEKLRARLEGTTQQDIYLEPMDATVVFAAERPMALELPSSLPGGASQPVPEGVFLDRAGRYSTDDVYATGRQAGIHYTAHSRLAPPPDEILRAVPTASPEEQAALSRYLDVSEVPAEVLELGRRITAKARGPFEKTEAVKRFLASGFRYTLELVHDEKKEPLAEFLFERKQGHCEYFASAMAVLLRAAGVPTRHVAGFYGGEWNSVGRYVQVRQRDAHAWVEVWLGEAGWVSFDPTPAGAGPGMSDGEGLGARLRQMLDVVQLAWFKYVIEYDLTTQLDLFSRLRRMAREYTFGPERKLRDKSGAGLERIRLRPLLGPLVLGVLLLGAYLLVRLRRRLGPGRRRGPAVAARAGLALARALKALGKRGLERKSAETPRALGRRAQQAGDPGAEAFVELVERYYAARYGEEAPSREDEARTEALLRAVLHPDEVRDEAARATGPSTGKAA